MQLFIIVSLQSNPVASHWQANVIRKTTVLDVMRRLLQAREHSSSFLYIYENCSHGVFLYRPKISWFPLVLEQKKLARQNIYQF